MDVNKRQSLGNVADVISLELLDDKSDVFGWKVERSDAHAHDAIRSSLHCFQNGDRKALSPVIRADSDTGEGVDSTENNLHRHYRSANEEEYVNSKQQLNGFK